MKPWWECWPGRLEHEIAELKKAGIPCERDEDAFNKGIVVLNLRHTVNGKEQKFFVVFPDVYPYIRFEIFAPDLNLEHHQNPFQKNVCMIGRSTANWHTSDTVAAFLLSRLPVVIQAGTSSDPKEAKHLEELQGEPITSYYPYSPNSVVLVDSSWSIDPSVDGGILELGIDRTLRSGLHCVIRAVKDRTKNIIAAAEPELANLYPNRIEGRWVRCKNPILENNQNQFYRQLVAHDRSLEKPKWQKLNMRKVAIVGALFSEEVAWREKKDGWLFLVLDRGGKITK